MLQLFRLFLDIALWRKGPQDVPASGIVVALAVIAYLGASAAQLAFVAHSGLHYVASLVVDPLLIAGWIWVVLAIFGQRARFSQTVSAIFGTYALLMLVVLALLIAQTQIGFEENALAGFVLAWLVVFVLVTGRIVMIAVERGMLTGVAVMVTYIFANYGINQAIAPSPVA